MIIGPTRTGKGTLLNAIKYNNLKFYRRKDIKDKKFQASQAFFLAPEDRKAKGPNICGTISHAHNSHTLQPKIPFLPPYHGDFNDLNKYHLVDFPGIFEQRGPELDISIHLCLQKILMASKSAKVLVLVSANIFSPEQNSIVETIKKELNQMFYEPDKNLIIGITKTRMVQHLYDEEELLQIASGTAIDSPVRSFHGYKNILIIEQDDPSSIQEMIKIVNKKHCIKNFVKSGFIDPY